MKRDDEVLQGMNTAAQYAKQLEEIAEAIKKSFPAKKQELAKPVFQKEPTKKELLEELERLREMIEKAFPDKKDPNKDDPNKDDPDKPENERERERKSPDGPPDGPGETPLPMGPDNPPDGPDGPGETPLPMEPTKEEPVMFSSLTHQEKEEPTKEELTKEEKDIEEKDIEEKAREEIEASVELDEPTKEAIKREEKAEKMPEPKREDFAEPKDYKEAKREYKEAKKDLSQLKKEYHHEMAVAEMNVGDAEKHKEALENVKRLSGEIIAQTEKVAEKREEYKNLKPTVLDQVKSFGSKAVERAGVGMAKLDIITRNQINTGQAAMRQVNKDLKKANKEFKFKGKSAYNGIDEKVAKTHRGFINGLQKLKIAEKNNLRDMEKSLTQVFTKGEKVMNHFKNAGRELLGKQTIDSNNVKMTNSQRRLIAYLKSRQSELNKDIKDLDQSFTQSQNKSVQKMQDIQTDRTKEGLGIDVPLQQRMANAQMEVSANQKAKAPKAPSKNGPSR